MFWCPFVTDWKTEAQRGVRRAEVICEQDSGLKRGLTPSAVRSRTLERREVGRDRAEEGSQTPAQSQKVGGSLSAC